MKKMLEVCCCTYEDVKNAFSGGADRVELCSALASGGVTPSAALTEKVCADFGREHPVHVLIRPREGGFVYSPEEMEIMERDIALAKNAGAAGVVIGCLNEDNTINTEQCARLVKAADGMSVTFSRAFDIVPDMLDALATVRALGCNRILTSGGAPSAMEGRDTLKALNDNAGALIILAGAGVSDTNFSELMESTGVSEIHGSLRGSDGQNARSPQGVAFEGHRAVSEEKVRRISAAIH